MKVVKTVGICLLMLTFLAGCVATNQNVYQQNATIAEQVVSVMERYEMYYQLADEETQAEWREYFDPLLEHLNVMMNTYDQMVMDGMDTVTILSSIDRLKTQIMLELIRRNQENGE